MHHVSTIDRLVNLLDPAGDVLLNMTHAEALERVGSGDPARVRQIDGQFALVHKQGRIVRMARSIGRPLRYFIAKRAEGPCLIVAERIDEIARFLEQEGLAGQFHPSYTRMVPAHYVTEELDEGPILDQEVTRVSHRDSVADLTRKGRDLETIVLARAVRAHLEHRVLVYGRKTVVFG